MTKSYSQLMKQIARLQSEADEIRRKEAQGVIVRIKEAIQAYGLTATDLGLAQGKAPAAKGAKASRKRTKVRKARSKLPPKFRDESGNTWVGRGKRPDWLRSALAAGRKLEEFEIH